MTRDELTALAIAFRNDLQSIVPDWTDRQEHDPGVTLLQLFAFVTEQLLYSTPLPAGARPYVTDAMRALATLQDGEKAENEGLVRNHYFDGKLLSAEDLQLEQDYHRAKLWRHNRALHGAGIVTGLSVTIDPTSSATEPVVNVTAGYAITPSGEELSLSEPGLFRLCATASAGFVTLEYAERFLSPAPSATELGIDRPTRIQEGVHAGFAEHQPANGVVLARLKRHRNAWTVTAARVDRPPKRKR